MRPGTSTQSAENQRDGLRGGSTPPPNTPVVQVNRRVVPPRRRLSPTTGFSAGNQFSRRGDHQHTAGVTNPGNRPRSTNPCRWNPSFTYTLGGLTSGHEPMSSDLHFVELSFTGGPASRIFKRRDQRRESRAGELRCVCRRSDRIARLVREFQRHGETPRARSWSRLPAGSADKPGQSPVSKSGPLPVIPPAPSGPRRPTGRQPASVSLPLGARSSGATTYNVLSRHDGQRRKWHARSRTGPSPARNYNRQHGFQRPGPTFYKVGRRELGRHLSPLSNESSRAAARRAAGDFRRGLTASGRVSEISRLSWRRESRCVRPTTCYRSTTAGGEGHYGLSSRRSPAPPTRIAP